MLYSNLRLKFFFTPETNWKYSCKKHLYINIGTKMFDFIKNSTNTNYIKVSLINKNLPFDTIVILKI